MASGTAGLRRRLAKLLADADRLSAPVAFWWRDDDAQDHTAELDRLLRMAEARRLPIALAVIPAGATQVLARRLSGTGNAVVLQHGWQHKNHSPPEARASEVPENRPLDAIMRELAAGRRVLVEKFGERFIPVLVPPWNRLGDSVRHYRNQAGLPVLSAFGPRRESDGACVNAHLDIIDWRSRAARDSAKAYATLCEEVERRLQGHSEPVGILTHHLAHDEAAWSLLATLLEDLTGSPGAKWPPLDRLFGPPVVSVKRPATA